MTYRLLLFGLCIGPAVNAQSGHAERHDWYQHLKRPDSVSSCCSGMTVSATGEVFGDCRPTQARLKANGEWEAIIDEVWTDIPPAKVLPAELNREGIYAHICAHLKTREIYCFLPAGAGG